MSKRLVGIVLGVIFATFLSWSVAVSPAQATITVLNPQGQEAGAVQVNTLSAYNSQSSGSGILVVGVEVEDDPERSVSSVTFDGSGSLVALTQGPNIAQGATFNNRTEIWYLLAPDGIGDIVVTFDAAADGSAIAALVLEGAKQQGPEASVTAVDATSPVDTNITTLVANSMIIDAFGTNTQTANAVTQGPNQVEEVEVLETAGSMSSLSMSSELATTAQAYTLGWSGAWGRGAHVLTAWEEDTTAVTMYFVSDADGNDGDDGLSPRDAWATIDKVNTVSDGAGFAATDFINWNRGDTFGDAILDIDQSGTSGNPITFQSYGQGAKPKLGGTGLRNNWFVDTDWIACQDLHITVSDGGGNSTGQVYVTGDNFAWLNCDLTGASVAGADIDGIRFNASTGNVVDGGTFTDTNFHNILFFGASGGTVKNATFLTMAQGTTNSGDNIQIVQEALAVTIDNNTFDDTGSVNSDQNIDIKGGTGHVISNNTFISARFGNILIHDPLAGGTCASVTLSDNDFANSRSGWVSVNDQQGCGVTLVFNRNNFHDGVNVDGFIIGSDGDSVGSLTFNADAFLVEAGDSQEDLLDLHNGTDVTLNNVTAVMRNGAGAGLQIFRMRADYTGNLTIRNSILDGDGLWLINENGGGAAVFSLLSNLYESDADPWFTFDTIGTKDESHVGDEVGGNPVGDVNSITGPPDFATEDPTDAGYLRLVAGSPAIAAGSSSFEPEFDLFGNPFDTSTPSIGAREFLGIIYFVKSLGDNGLDGLTDATAWATIAKVNEETFLPGDTIQLNRGDSFGDVRLNFANAGTSGNPITLQAYGSGAKPILGSDALLRQWLVDTAWIACKDIHIRDSSGSGADTTAHVDIEATGDNFDADGCDITGSTAGAFGIKGYLVEGATGVTIRNLTVTDIAASGIVLTLGAEAIITNISFGPVGKNAQGDMFITQGGAGFWTGTATLNDSTFDDGGASGGSQEQCMDTKGSGTLTINNTTWVAGGCSNDAMLIQFDTVVIINDSRILGGLIQVGSAANAGAASLTLNRTIVIATGTPAAQRFIEVGAAGQEDATFTCNASTIVVASPSPSGIVIRANEDSTVTLNNCTVLGRTGDTLTFVLEADGDCTGCSFIVKNSILDTDGNNVIVKAQTAAATLTFTRNLYESTSTGLWIDDDGTGNDHNEASVTSTFDTNGATGDPNFASETSTDDGYLMLGPASSGIGLGAAADLYNGSASTDLLKYPFRNLTPNAGARAHRWRTKFPRFGINMEITPIEPLEEEETVSIWPLALECECETPGAVNDNWPLALECECVQAAR